MKHLLEQMHAHASEPAIAKGQTVATYRQLLDQFHVWQDRLIAARLDGGTVVSIEGEYGLETIAAFLAVTSQGHVAVPLSSDSRARHEKFLQVAQVQWRIRVAEGQSQLEPVGIAAEHPLYEKLRETKHPGLVLFTSGSTGESKGAVHDLQFLLEKFHVSRQQLRTLVFLQLDHIGGVNTLLYTLSNGGTVVSVEDRSPASICAAIAKHRVQLLPTSPTFLNLLLLSEEYRRHDLSSLRLITYGTEPMPPSTLQRVHEAFPKVRLQQTYGMTELGILRSKSRDSDSLWVKVGGEGFDTKVVDDRLWVRARSAMLGYLNAPSPFDNEGFLDTGDRVEVDGTWLRILGRDSELINVGGHKVFPAEVESVLLELEGVTDATVCGGRHPLTGQIVTATVQLSSPEAPRDFRIRMRNFCRQRLPAYAIPAQVRLSEQSLHNERFKRMRSGGQEAEE